MAQCAVHALKGLACRASPSRARRGHKNIILLSLGPTLRYPAVPEESPSSKSKEGIAGTAAAALIACVLLLSSSNCTTPPAGATGAWRLLPRAPRNRAGADELGVPGEAIVSLPDEDATGAVVSCWLERKASVAAWLQ